MKKNILLKFLFIVLFVFIIMPDKGNALAETKFECTKDGTKLNNNDTVNVNDEINCSLKVTVDNDTTFIDPSDTPTLENVEIINITNVGASSTYIDWDDVGTGVKYNEIEVNAPANDKEIANLDVRITGTPTANIEIPTDYKEEGVMSGSITAKLTLNVSAPLSGDTKPSSVTINDGNVDFDGNKTYSKTVSSDTTEVSLEISASSGGKVRYGSTESANINVTVPLTNDTTTINFWGIAENGTEDEYTLVIKKEASTSDPGTSTGEESIATLSSITINGKKINIRNGIKEYSYTVKNSVEKIDIGTTTTASGASVEVQGDPNLAEGEVNVFKIIVTSKDGSETETYTLNVTREMPNPDTSIIIPLSVIGLGIAGGLAYMKFRKKTYIQKI